MIEKDKLVLLKNIERVMTERRKIALINKGGQVELKQKKKKIFAKGQAGTN